MFVRVMKPGDCSPWKRVPQPIRPPAQEIASRRWFIGIERRRRTRRRDAQAETTVDRDLFEPTCSCLEGLLERTKAPAEGIEPSNDRLTAGCLTIRLRWKKLARRVRTSCCRLAVSELL